MASQIQRAFRAHMSRKIAAAVKIQSLVRGSMEQNMFKAQMNAVIIIQSLLRGHLGRSSAKTKSATVFAVIKIQTFFRMKMARNALQNYRENIAATKVQRLFRGHIERQIMYSVADACARIAQVVMVEVIDLTKDDDDIIDLTEHANFVDLTGVVQDEVIEGSI